MLIETGEHFCVQEFFWSLSLIPLPKTTLSGGSENLKARGATGYYFGDILESLGHFPVNSRVG